MSHDIGRVRQRWQRRTFAAERSEAVKDKADSAAEGDAKKIKSLLQKRVFLWATKEFHYKTTKRLGLAAHLIIKKKCGFTAAMEFQDFLRDTSAPSLKGKYGPRRKPVAEKP